MGGREQEHSQTRQAVLHHIRVNGVTQDSIDDWTIVVLGGSIHIHRERHDQIALFSLDRQISRRICVCVFVPPIIGLVLTLVPSIPLCLWLMTVLALDHSIFIHHLSLSPLSSVFVQFAKTIHRKWMMQSERWATIEAMMKEEEDRKKTENDSKSMYRMELEGSNVSLLLLHAPNSTNAKVSSQTMIDRSRLRNDRPFLFFLLLLLLLCWMLLSFLVFVPLFFRLLWRWGSYVQLWAVCVFVCLHPTFPNGSMILHHIIDSKSYRMER